MIVQTVSFYDFERAFSNLRPENFSRDGLRVLFDYLEELSEDTGEPIELDVIAICCDYSEDTPEDIADNYSIDTSECEDDTELLETVLEYLQYHTGFCQSTDNGTIVYSQF